MLSVLSRSTSTKCNCTSSGLPDTVWKGPSLFIESSSQRLRHHHPTQGHLGTSHPTTPTRQSRGEKADSGGRCEFVPMCSLAAFFNRPNFTIYRLDQHDT